MLASLTFRCAPAQRLSKPCPRGRVSARSAFGTAPSSPLSKSSSLDNLQQAVHYCFELEVQDQAQVRVE
jgi:hypothetical protein